MKAFLFALSISIVIHLLAFLEIKVNKLNTPPQPTDKKTIPKGSDVKFVKLLPKPIEPKKEPVKSELPKEYKKVEQIKPIQKKVKSEPKPIPN